MACVTAPVRSQCTSYCDPVNLGTAGDFAILSKTGITSTGLTKVTGDMGTSPITGAAITGFALVPLRKNPSIQPYYLRSVEDCQSRFLQNGLA